MKHLRHINENSFDKLSKDAQHIINIAIDEGLTIAVKHLLDRAVVLIYNYPIRNNVIQTDGHTIMDRDKFIELIVDIYDRLDNEEFIIHDKKGKMSSNHFAGGGVTQPINKPININQIKRCEKFGLTAISYARLLIDNT